MTARALIDKSPWLIASLIAGIAFYFLRDAGLPDAARIALKGSGVALLAVYALTRLEGSAAKQIGAIMAFGALGDVLIEFELIWGAIAFLVGHLIAVRFYWGYRRERLSFSQMAFGWVILLAVPVIAFLLPSDRAAAPGVAFYSLGLAAMTAAAWTSRFSRYRVGIGAVMFVISDLLIFSRMGPLEHSIIPDLLIWPLYYFGQFLICTGVVDTLRRGTRGLANRD